MLQLMRDNVGNWFIKILLGAIALAFALSFGFYNYGKPKVVALTVNDQPVTESEIREVKARQTELLRKQYGDQFDKIAPMLKLEEQAKEYLISQILLDQAARDLGIEVGNAEVQAYIQSIPAFKANGVFNKQAYQYFLNQQRMTPREYEDQLRRDIAMRKLQSLVAANAQVTPLELKAALKRDLAKVKGVYKTFKAADFENKVELAEDELKAWYDQNKKRFLVPEKMVLTYVKYPLANYRDQADVREDDIEYQYEMDRKLYFTPERVKASHILFRLPQGATKTEIEAVRKKAEEVLALAKEPEADFAELAKQHSEGPTSVKGGDLGYISKGSNIFPAFEKKIFGMKNGAIDLVKTPVGWHVVKVFDHQKASLTPLEEVRGELRAKLVERQAKDLAEAAAERGFDLAAQGVKPEEVAKQTKGELGTAGPVSITGPIPGLMGLKELGQAQIGVEPGQVMNVLNFDGGSIVAYVDKRIPETVEPFEQVEEKVRLAVKDKKAAQMAKKAAKDLLDRLAGETDPGAKLKAEQGAVETGWLGRMDSVKGLMASGALQKALFMRPNSKPVLKNPVEAAGNTFIAAVKTGYEEPEEAEMKAKEEDVKQRLLVAKQKSLETKFMQDLRANAEIKVNVSQ
jgi:peptidyl-prolyl cis-trans isomerase D